MGFRRGLEGALRAPCSQEGFGRFAPFPACRRGAPRGGKALPGIAAIATTEGRALDDAGRIQARAVYICQDNEGRIVGTSSLYANGEGRSSTPSVRFAIYSYGF